MELTPEECEQLIRTYGSEASLTRYLDTIAQRVSESAAKRVETYSHGFARTGPAYGDAGSGVVDVLADVAETIEKSRLPIEPISQAPDEA